MCRTIDLNVPDDAGELCITFSTGSEFLTKKYLASQASRIGINEVRKSVGFCIFVFHFLPPIVVLTTSYHNI